MKKWKGLVCVPMWQEMEIEAETYDEAKATMLDLFEMDKAGPGESYVYDLEELQGEVK